MNSIKYPKTKKTNNKHKIKTKNNNSLKTTTKQQQNQKHMTNLHKTGAHLQEAIILITWYRQSSIEIAAMRTIVHPNQIY